MIFLLSQTNCIMFSLQTTQMFSFREICLRKLINILLIELDKLYAWLQSNKLTLNLLKTHYMVFHRAKHKHVDVKLCINKVPIQQVFLKISTDQSILCIYISVPHLLCRGMG